MEEQTLFNIIGYSISALNIVLLIILLVNRDAITRWIREWRTTKGQRTDKHGGDRTERH